MPDLDWVSWWKIVSIVLTGAFGVLGLLTKYRDDAGRITKWGKASLAGILLFTTFGAAAQIKESSDKEADAADKRKQTLQIVEQTQRSVVNLDRLLRPLDAPALSVQFKVPCEHKDYTAFCEVFRDSDDSVGSDYTEMWKKWPSSRRSHLPHQAEVLVSVSIFGRDNRKAAASRLAASDWQFEYRVRPAAEHGLNRNAMDVFLAPDGEVTIDLGMDAPTRNSNQGTLQSVLDLEGADIVLSVSSAPVLPPPPQPTSKGNVTVGIKPSYFVLRLRNGQDIELPIDDLAEERPAFEYVDKSFSTKLVLKKPKAGELR